MTPKNSFENRPPILGSVRGGDTLRCGVGVPGITIRPLAHPHATRAAARQPLRRQMHLNGDGLAVSLMTITRFSRVSASVLPSKASAGLYVAASFVVQAACVVIQSVTCCIVARAPVFDVCMVLYICASPVHCADVCLIYRCVLGAVR